LLIHDEVLIETSSKMGFFEILIHKLDHHLSFRLGGRFGLFVRILVFVFPFCIGIFF